MYSNFINKNFIDGKPELTPIRKGFGEGLLEVAKKDARVVGLCADLTDSTYMHLFRKEFPGRFVEIGVAEQNLATVASGMSAMGKIPVISSYAVFSPGRNWEQIRTTICLNNRKVIIAGSHAGVSVGPDGATHQALEDIALMRILPNMTVLSPCDSIEAKKAVIEAIKIKGPVYIRLARESTSIVTTEETPFKIGKAEIFYDGRKDENDKLDVCVFCIGPTMPISLKVADKLNKEGIKIVVVNSPSIKPLDENLIISLTNNAGAVVTVETHQIAGGLGGAIAELLAKNCPVPMEFVGVKDRFGQSGTPDELMSEYYMDEVGLEEAVRKVLIRKK
jgi:transketolase